jgi:urease accessory protein
LAAGLVHPLLGLDHLIAMLAVGLWAGRLGGRALWLLPLAFIALAAAGAGVAFVLPVLPIAELAIIASLVVLGALLAFEVRMATISAAALVGFFALFHGHAHIADASAATAWTGYALGFLAMTALLHGAGIGLGRVLAAGAPRWLGAIAAITGGGLALGL